MEAQVIAAACATWPSVHLLAIGGSNDGLHEGYVEVSRLR